MEDLDSDVVQQQLAAIVVREKEISARRAELYEMVRRGASWSVVLDEMRVLEVETYRMQQM